MGRLLALILGGLALALFVPPFFLKESAPPAAAATAPEPNAFDKVFIDTIGSEYLDKLKRYGAGVFAGLALVLIAVRGKD